MQGVNIMKRSIVIVVIVIAVAILSFIVGQKYCCERTQGDKCQAEKKVTVTFPGAEKHEVSLAEAKQYIQDHSKSLQSQKSKTPQIKGEAFEKIAIEKILAQPGCAQLRIYYGKTETGQPNLVLVGVDTSGKDMTKTCMMERGTLCPPFCDGQSILIQP
jgi:hypothetical protein